MASGCSAEVEAEDWFVGWTISCCGPGPVGTCRSGSVGLALSSVEEFWSWAELSEAWDSVGVGVSADDSPELAGGAVSEEGAEPVADAAAPVG